MTNPVVKIVPMPGPQGTTNFLSIGSNVLPTSDNVYNLGSASKRWHSLYIGPGTLFITDQTAGYPVAEISVNAGVFNIGGVVQAQLPNVKVTNLTFNDNTVQTTASKAMYYGSFESNIDQLNVAGGMGSNLITFGTDTGSVGVSYDSGVTNSKITFTNAGTYSFNLLVEYLLTTTGGSFFNGNIWYKKNGTSVTNSAVSFYVANTANAQTVGVLEDLITVDAGDYIQFFWWSSNNNFKIYRAPGGGPAQVPSSPSVRLSVTRVG